MYMWYIAEALSDKLFLKRKFKTQIVLSESISQSTVALETG